MKHLVVLALAALAVFGCNQPTLTPTDAAPTITRIDTLGDSTSTHSYGAAVAITGASIDANGGLSNPASGSRFWSR